ncbi:ATP-binding mismatch repair protein [Boothiomyces sp. JEL0866]|nr:ATP-binding mismatch repair protein [Boothiomyces sp. JEL0866]
MNILTRETQQKLSSAQSVPTPDSIVKELIEYQIINNRNSLDANSTSITVTIKNAGLDGITISDNGTGIDDLDLVCMRYTTSKITNFDDISTTSCYGFRGEALNSICSIAGGLIIATKKEGDPLGTICEYDVNGNLKSKSVKSMKNGTVIEIKQLFSHLPVRRQVFSKKTAEICRKIKEIVLSYSIINYAVRLSLKVGSDAAFVKTPSTSISESIASIFGNGTFKKLQLVQVEKLQYQIDCYIAKHDYKSDQSLWKSSNTLPKFYINQRPAHIDKFLSKFINECRAVMHPDTNHFPLIVVAITLPPEDVDVNVEPDKSRVIFSNAELVKELLDQILTKAYPSNESSMLLDNDVTIVNNDIGTVQSLNIQNIELTNNISLESEKENVKGKNVNGNSTLKTPNKHFNLADQLLEMISDSNARSPSSTSQKSMAVPDFHKLDSTIEVDLDDWSRGKANSVKIRGQGMEKLENNVKINQANTEYVQTHIPINPFQSKFNKNIERNRPADCDIVKQVIRPTHSKQQSVRYEHTVPSQQLEKSQPKIDDIFKKKCKNFYTTLRSIMQDSTEKVDPYNPQSHSETYSRTVGRVDFRGKHALKVLLMDDQLYLVDLQRVVESYTCSDDAILENLTETETCPHGKPLMMKI